MMTPATASDFANRTLKFSSVAHLLITSPARKGNSPGKKLIFFTPERVDTRVLQVIYRIEDDNLQLFVGQQMDVFIDAADVRTAMKR